MARFFVRRDSRDQWYTRRPPVNVWARADRRSMKEETRQSVSIAAFFITAE